MAIQFTAISPVGDASGGSHAHKKSQANWSDQGMINPDVVPITGIEGTSGQVLNSIRVHYKGGEGNWHGEPEHGNPIALQSLNEAVSIEVGWADWTGTDGNYGIFLVSLTFTQRDGSKVSLSGNVDATSTASVAIPSDLQATHQIVALQGSTAVPHVKPGVVPGTTQILTALGAFYAADDDLNGLGN